MWSRDNTKEWIFQLQHRIEDIDYYLQRTIDWCEHNGVWADQKVFACCVMAVIWVSHMRGEPVSKRELFEILGIADWDQVEDVEYTLVDPKFVKMDLDELLDNVVQRFDD